MGQWREFRAEMHDTAVHCAGDLTLAELHRFRGSGRAGAGTGDSSAGAPLGAEHTCMWDGRPRAHRLHALRPRVLYITCAPFCSGSTGLGKADAPMADALRAGSAPAVGVGLQQQHHEQLRIIQELTEIIGAGELALGGSSRQSPARAGAQVEDERGKEEEKQQHQQAQEEQGQQEGQRHWRHGRQERQQQGQEQAPYQAQELRQVGQQGEQQDQPQQEQLEEQQEQLQQLEQPEQGQQQQGQAQQEAAAAGGADAGSSASEAAGQAAQAQAQGQQAERVCTHCSVTSRVTPYWRTHPETGAVICGRCRKHLDRRGTLPVVGCPELDARRRLEITATRAAYAQESGRAGAATAGAGAGAAAAAEAPLLCTHCGTDSSNSGWRRHPATYARLCGCCANYYGRRSELPSERVLAKRRWRADACMGSPAAAEHRGDAGEAGLPPPVCSHCQSDGGSSRLMWHPLTSERLCLPCSTYIRRTGKLPSKAVLRRRVQGPKRKRKSGQRAARTAAAAAAADPPQLPAQPPDAPSQQLLQLLLPPPGVATSAAAGPPQLPAQPPDAPAQQLLLPLPGGAAGSSAAAGAAAAAEEQVEAQPLALAGAAAQQQQQTQPGASSSPALGGHTAAPAGLVPGPLQAASGVAAASGTKRMKPGGPCGTCGSTLSSNYWGRHPVRREEWCCFACR